MIISIVMLQYAEKSNGENILRILIRIYIAGGKKESSRPLRPYLPRRDIAHCHQSWEEHFLMRR